MQDILLKIQDACLQLDAISVGAPAVVAIILGLVLWLGGQRYAAFVIGILGAVVGEHPTYGAARGKLVDAYLLQGLDFYSRGELTAALKALRRALIYDPGNAKVKRYIKRVEGELK